MSTEELLALLSTLRTMISFKSEHAQPQGQYTVTLGRGKKGKLCLIFSKLLIGDAKESTTPTGSNLFYFPAATLTTMNSSTKLVK